MQILHPNIVLANIRKQVFGDNMLPSKKIKISLGKKEKPISNTIMSDIDFMKHTNNQYEDTREYLFYSDGKCIVIIDKTKYIPMSNEFYNQFEDELKTVINKWNDFYDGNSDISWNIEISVDTNHSEETKIYYGNGGVPTNWEEFIELITTFDNILNNKNEKTI